MARKTEVEKLNDQADIIEQQISNIENELFQHEMTVEDNKITSDQVKDPRAAAALRVQAAAAATQIVVCKRRLEVREQRLAEVIAAIEKASLTPSE